MKTSLYLQYFEKKNICVPLFDRQKMVRSAVGDYLKVGFIFKEGDKKRIQFFEGIIIATYGSMFAKKITLRQPGTYGVERSFFCQSPQIQTFQILQSQKFRQSKLFFLRKCIGKAAFGISKKVFDKNQNLFNTRLKA